MLFNRGIPRTGSTALQNAKTTGAKGYIPSLTVGNGLCAVPGRYVFPQRLQLKPERELNIRFPGNAVGGFYVAAPAVDAAEAPHGGAEGQGGAAGGGEFFTVVGPGQLVGGVGQGGEGKGGGGPGDGEGGPERHRVSSWVSMWQPHSWGTR